MKKLLILLAVLCSGVLWVQAEDTVVSFSSGTPSGWSAENVAKQTKLSESCLQLQTNGEITSPKYTDVSKITLKLSISGNATNLTVAYSTDNKSSWTTLKTIAKSDCSTSAWTDIAIDVNVDTSNGVYFKLTSAKASYYISTFTVTTVTDNRAGSGLDAPTDVQQLNAGETLTNPLTNPNGITGITYSSSNNEVATVDANGNVTGVARGTATITAKFEGNETYKPIEVSYSVKVKLPQEAEATFDFTQPKTLNPSQTGDTTNGITVSNTTFSNNNITLKGSNCKIYTGEIRIYSGSSTTIATDASLPDLRLSEISFKYSDTSNQKLSLPTTQKGSLTTSNNYAIWTDNSGQVTSVTFDSSGGQSRVATVVVTYVTLQDAQMAFPQESYETLVGSTFEAPTVTLPEDATGEVTYSAAPDGLTIDATTGAISNINTAGTYTITATFAGDAKYKAATATYTLTVTADANATQPIFSIADDDYSDKSAGQVFVGAKLTISAPENAGDSYTIYYKLNDAEKYLTSTEAVELTINDDVKVTSYVNDQKYEISANYTVATIGELTISNEFGEIAEGSEVTITCATEGATLTGTIGTQQISAETSVTFTVDEDLDVDITATHPRYKGTAALKGSYKVKGLEYSWTCTTNDTNAEKKQSVDYKLNNVTWTATMSTTTGAYHAVRDGGTTPHYTFGSSSDILNLLTFSTDDFKGYDIQEVIVKTLYTGGDADLSVTVGSNDFGTKQTISNSSASYTFTGSASGTLTILWDNFKTTGKQVHLFGLTVKYRKAKEAEKTDVTLTWKQDDTEVTAIEHTLGKDFTAPTLTVDPEEAASAVQYSSSDTEVADFVDGTLTIKAAGTTTIKAAIADNATYNDASASYTLTVKEAETNPDTPSTDETSQPGTIEFTFTAEDDNQPSKTIDGITISSDMGIYIIDPYYVMGGSKSSGSITIEGESEIKGIKKVELETIKIVYDTYTDDYRISKEPTYLVENVEGSDTEVGSINVDADKGIATWEASDGTLAKTLVIEPEDSYIAITKVSVTWDYVTPVFVSKSVSDDKVLTLQVKNGHKVYYKILSSDNSSTKTNAPAFKAADLTGLTEAGLENDGWTVNDNSYTYKLSDLATTDLMTVYAVNGTKQSEEVTYNQGGQIVSGIEGVAADSQDAPVEYYNLQGVRVSNPGTGLYIRRQGTKVEKVAIR
jgi:hypothetical protein